MTAVNWLLLLGNWIPIDKEHVSVAEGSFKYFFLYVVLTGIALELQRLSDWSRVVIRKCLFQHVTELYFQVQMISQM